MNITEMEKEIKDLKDKESKTYSYHKETEASQKELDFGLKIVIDDMVYRKVMHWVNKSSDEVSGLGMVEFDPDTNTLRVTDAIMLKQKNTGGSTDIDAQSVAKAMYQFRNHPGELKWWWHSHVNMNVFWSGTDITTIKQLGGPGWFCATVFNKRNEAKSAFVQKDPVRLLVPEIPTQIQSTVDPEILRLWNAEYDENVVKEVKSYMGYNFRSWNTNEQESKKETKEDNSQDEEFEVEEIRSEDGSIVRYKKVKKKPNLVAVKSLKEVRDAIIQAKNGGNAIPDFSNEEEETQRWNNLQKDIQKDKEQDEGLKRLMEQYEHND